MGASISVSKEAAAAVVQEMDAIPMTVEELPPANTKRWVIRRKAEVVAAVRAGVISLEEACARYTLSTEEFLSWQRLIDSHGVRGLRTTRLQDYRRPETKSRKPACSSVPLSQPRR